MSVEIRHYTNDHGRRPYEKWLSNLDNSVRPRIESKIDRLADNLELGKSIGGDVHQLEIDVGPGYRIFYTMVDGCIYLLGGGDKSNQQEAIDAAKRDAKNLKDRLSQQPDNSPAR